MRTPVLIAFASALFIGQSPCLAMGYGGGMPGANTPSGGMSSMGTADYAAALRLIRAEKFAEAIPYLEKTLRARPGNADVLNYLGFTERMVGNYPASLDYYQRALARNPDHKGAHEYLGELYLKLNQIDNARGQLAELTRLCPSGCQEKDVLTQAIADYQLAATAPTAPGTAAVPASAPAPTTAQPATPAPTPNP